MDVNKEKKSNKKWLIVIAILVLIAIIVLVTLKLANKDDTSIAQNKENTPESVNKETKTEKESPDACPVDEICEEITINAYDYIMEVMSAPQYWSYEDFFTAYDLDDQEEFCQAKLKEQNGTGWLLADEKTATFKRGAQGILQINFSNNTARSDLYSNSISEESDYTSKYSEHDIIKYDFNNYEFNYMFGFDDDNISDYDTSYDVCAYRTREDFDNNAHGFDEFGHNEEAFDDRWVIEDTMLYYESLFEEAGCPLLNMPEGTLESYKNKTVSFVKHTKKDDGLIHRIWEQDGYRWDWENSEGYIRLENNDPAKIFEKQVPTGSTKINIKDEKYGNGVWDYYAPVFLIEEDSVGRAMYMKDHFKNTGYSLNAVTDDWPFLGANAGAFAIYFIKPMMELMYGYNAVYFYNTDNNRRATMDDHERVEWNPFDKNSIVEKAKKDVRLNDDIFAIHPNGDYHMYFTASGGGGIEQYIKMYDYIMELADYYGVESPFAKDYLVNFELFYWQSNRQKLGLY